MNFIWQSLSMVLIILSIRGDCKEECISAIKLAAVSNTVFDLKVKALRYREKCIQNAVDTSWILQVNDTEAGISLNYPVKCQQGCQHCNDESLRPHPPQEIAYTSTTGSNLCFKWKGSVSTNYTMHYTQNRGYCSDLYTRCTADRLENDVLECCPQNLHPVAPIYVRIDYENEYMYVYGIVYWLRAQTIAIPNPLKNFTYQLLDNTTVEFMFEDPEDWNFYSFSLLDKRICQISPPVEEGCRTKTFQYPPNSWKISGLSYDTQYKYSAQCYHIEGRWSEEKIITFKTGGHVSTDEANSSPGPRVTTKMDNTSTTVTMFASVVRNQYEPDTPDQPDQNTNKVLLALGLILAAFGIAAVINILFRGCRWASKKLFWEIPEPNIPHIIKYHSVDFRVPNIVVEVFDELRTRNDTFSLSWNKDEDSGQGTSEGTPDECNFIEPDIPLQLLNYEVSTNHMHTHRGFIHENSDDSDEDYMGSNHSNGVGIVGISFMSLIYENKLLLNENMRRKLHVHVNDNDDNSYNDEDDDDDGDDNNDDGNNDKVNDNDDDSDADGDVRGDVNYIQRL